jgi:hypothetical protein
MGYTESAAYWSGEICLHVQAFSNFEKPMYEHIYSGILSITSMNDKAGKLMLQFHGEVLKYEF